ncbi:MAG: hypothetical protein QOG58_5672 [Caballeronia sp.]|nr:hypothetical protein [Caballeronia sp.]
MFSLSCLYSAQLFLHSEVRQLLVTQCHHLRADDLETVLFEEQACGDADVGMEDREPLHTRRDLGGGVIT